MTRVDYLSKAGVRERKKSDVRITPNGPWVVVVDLETGQAYSGYSRVGQPPHQWFADEVAEYLEGR
jgi:hypothetical protein